MYFALYAYQEDARRLRGVCASTRALDAHRVPLPAPFGQERPGVPGSGSTSWTPRPRASPSSTRTGWWFPRSAGSRRPARRASPCGTCSPSTRPRPGLTHIMRRPRAHRPCAGVVGWHARRNTWRSAHRAEWERCSGDALRCDREPVTPAPDGLPGQRYRQRRARDRRPRWTRDPWRRSMLRCAGHRVTGRPHGPARPGGLRVDDHATLWVPNIASAQLSPYLNSSMKTPQRQALPRGVDAHF